MKTAEQTLKAFLKAWINQDKKKMHFHTTKTWQSSHDKNAFAAKNLESFSIETKTQNISLADFKVKLNGQEMTCRLVLEKAPYRAGDDQTEADIELCKKFKLSSAVAWGVNPISFRPV